jgi:hypothetical protein
VADRFINLKKYQDKRYTIKTVFVFADQLEQYTNALLQVYGEVVYPVCKPGSGRSPNPRLVPAEDLLYVQVVKQYKKYRVVKVTQKLTLAILIEIESILAASALSNKINTSYVERYNGTVRHMHARCGRKALCFLRCQENHEIQLALSLGYYHLCRPHKTLTKRYGRPITPFMAANLTHRV